MAELEFPFPPPPLSRGEKRKTERDSHGRKKFGKGWGVAERSRKSKKRTTTKIRAGEQQHATFFLCHCGSFEVYVFNLTGKQILSLGERGKTPHLYCHILGKGGGEEEQHTEEETLWGRSLLDGQEGDRRRGERDELSRLVIFFLLPLFSALYSISPPISSSQIWGD